MLRNFYLTGRFFVLFANCIWLIALSFAFKILFFPAIGALVFLAAFTLVDVFILFRKKNAVVAARKHTQVLSMGDENKIKIELKVLYNFNTKLTIIDELPVELQERNFSIKTQFSPNHSAKTLEYPLQPKSRGKYFFGNINIFVRSALCLAERRFIVSAEHEVAVFPSVIQMKNFELKALTSISHFQGIKKIRRIGHSYEFEQIKQYIPGDDTRSLNWKASSRATQLMVNQYEDERSQAVYCIIDKSRGMRMPFNEMSLLDYAINTSLVISNIVLRKHDKAGMLSFSNKLGTFIKAEKNEKQLNKIIQALYKEKVLWPEADFELLYSAVRNFIHGRSLLFLFTNFESTFALERVLPLLRKLNQMHLLVVMFFENTELSRFAGIKCENLLEINQQTAAKELMQHKELIFQLLKMHGIQAIQTKPEELSLNTVNKYLELKSRGLI